MLDLLGDILTRLSRRGTRCSLTSITEPWRVRVPAFRDAARGLPVAEAAEVSGHASESAFSRVFKKEIGISPAAFRQSGFGRDMAA